MKLQMIEMHSNEDIPQFLKESLASHYRDILLFRDSVPNIYIKLLAYHAIAYFQYLNILSANDAVKLYKQYILSNGEIKSFKYLGYEIPLIFDELLASVSQTLMKYKDIVQKINTNKYVYHFRNSHGFTISNIIIYHLLNIFNKIGLEGIAALKRHWTVINQKFIPYILKNLNNNSTI